MNKISKILRCSLVILLLLSLTLCLYGCYAAGAIANIAIPKRAEAKYAGLAEQSAGVMVWVDRAAKFEWESIQIDLANQIQNKLSGNPAKELKGTTWPVSAGFVLRYQVEHPGIEAIPITDTAPKLGVSRLIYVEVEQFSTRAEATYQMFRGSVTATLRVVEVSGGTAKIGYEEAGIRAFFPPKSPPDGVVNATDAVIYRGTIATLAQEIADRLASRDLN